MALISVIICTRNPRPDYLSRVLSALRAQTLPLEDWDLLLIDNASDSRLADEWDLSWHPRARQIREDRLGLTPARLRGIGESCGEILVYVDDDNVLAPHYLQTAHALLTKHPYLGVIGAGTLEPEFEVQPPPEIVPHLGRLALRRVPRACWSNNTNDQAVVPWGAGLCVTRRVAQSYVELLEQLGLHDLLDLRGECLYGNGDVAFSWSSVMIDRGFGVFPLLHVTHLISAERVTQRYVLRLAHDRSFSGGIFDYLWTGMLPADDLGLGGQYLRLCLRGITKGSFAMRLAWAAVRGADRARSFIKGRCLQPLPSGRP